MIENIGSVDDTIVCWIAKANSHGHTSGVCWSQVDLTNFSLSKIAKYKRPGQLERQICLEEVWMCVRVCALTRKPREGCADRQAQNNSSSSFSKLSMKLAGTRFLMRSLVFNRRCGRSSSNEPVLLVIERAIFLIDAAIDSPTVTFSNSSNSLS